MATSYVNSRPGRTANTGRAPQFDTANLAPAERRVPASLTLRRPSPTHPSPHPTREVGEDIKKMGGRSRTPIWKGRRGHRCRPDPTNDRCPILNWLVLLGDLLARSPVSRTCESFWRVVPQASNENTWPNNYFGDASWLYSGWVQNSKTVQSFLGVWTAPGALGTHRASFQGCLAGMPGHVAILCSGTRILEVVGAYCAPCVRPYTRHGSSAYEGGLCGPPRTVRGRRHICGGPAYESIRDVL